MSSLNMSDCIDDDTFDSSDRNQLDSLDWNQINEFFVMNKHAHNSFDSSDRNWSLSLNS